MNSLIAYEELATKLTKTSEKLLESNNYNDKLIRKSNFIMNEKWKGLKTSAREKQARLEQSKLLQQFMQDCNEVDKHKSLNSKVSSVDRLLKQWSSICYNCITIQKTLLEVSS